MASILERNLPAVRRKHHIIEGTGSSPIGWSDVPFLEHLSGAGLEAQKSGEGAHGAPAFGDP